MTPRLEALHGPIVADVLNRLQLHADAQLASLVIVSRPPAVAALAPTFGSAALPPFSIEGNLREFVERHVRSLLEALAAGAPAWVSPEATEALKGDVVKLAEDAALGLLRTLLALRTYTPPVSGD
jgi:hypothetical protein